MVPYEENPWFVGRDELISQLFEMLCDSKEHQHNHRVALHGLGGVGKTQTALKYIYSKREYYHSIFWISAVNQATLLTEFQKIMAHTQPNVPMPGSPDQVAKLVISWLEKQSSWLLVVDNLDDINVIDGFLPVNRNRRHTLITTRNPSAENIPAQGLEVDLMSSTEATKFLLIRAGFPLDSESHTNEAGKIVQELGCLPLAIEQAAAFIRESKRPIDAYLPLYQKNRSIRQKLQKWTPKGNRKYHYSIATTWQMSFDLVRWDAESPHAALLLQLLAFLNPDIILLEFLQAGSNGLDENLRNLLNDTMELEEALRVLAQLSLIKRIQDGRGIWIHRLIQDVIQHDLEEGDLHRWWEKVTKLCLDAFPEETNEMTRPYCRIYEEQVYIPMSKSPQINSNSLALLCSRVGRFFLHDGKYKQAEILCEKAYNTYHSIHGEQHSDTLMVMNDLALTYLEQGRLAKAVTLQTKVIDATKETLDDPEIRWTAIVNLNNLASTYSRQGRRGAAVVLMERVLEVTKAALGEQHPSSLKMMGNLADCYRNLGRWDEAVTLQKKVLEAMKAVFGERNPDTLTAMGNLAETYRTQGRWGEALTLEETVLEDTKAVLGEQHPDTLRAMGRLADTYRNHERWDEAVTLEKTVLEARKAVLGEQNPDTLTAMAGLAETYWNQGRLDEAVTLEEKVLEARKAVLGDLHRDTLMAMANLAATYSSQGRQNEAVMLSEKVLEARKVVLGEQHYETLKAMDNLATEYSNQGRWNEAVTLQEEMLEAGKAVLGDRHPDTLTAMTNLALTYLHQGRVAEAVEFQQSAADASKSVLGERHSVTIKRAQILFAMKHNLFLLRNMHLRRVVATKAPS